MSHLYPFQKKGVWQMERFGGRALVADEMGLGKSIQALWWGKNFLDEWPIVIVCPAHLKGHWQREAQKHFNMRVEILEGMKPTPVQIAFLRKKAIYVLNYDILSAWIPFLFKLGVHYIILDEIHYCKNRTAKRTKLIRKLCKDIPHVVGLTGTPVTNKLAELWSILNIIRPDKYNSFWSFASEYCEPEKKPWGWEFKGAKNVEKLNRELRSELMIRRLKSEVMSDLPAKQRIVFPIKLNKAARKEYDAALTDFISWLRKNFGKHKASRAAKAERMVKMGYLKRLAARLKMPSVIDWIKNFLDAEEGKLILFGISSGSILPEIFEKFRKQAVLVTGKLASNKRQGAFDAFVNTKQIRLLVGNIQAAGTGWPATGVPNTAFCEFAWNPSDHTQAEDRTHGLNRGVAGVNSSYRYFVAMETIDEYMMAVNQGKQEVADSVIDGRKVEEGFDVFSAYTEMLLGKKNG